MLHRVSGVSVPIRMVDCRAGVYEECVVFYSAAISNRPGGDARTPVGLSVCNGSVLFFTLVLFILLCSEIDVKERLCERLAE